MSSAQGINDARKSIGITLTIVVMLWLAAITLRSVADALSNIGVPVNENVVFNTSSIINIMIFVFSAAGALGIVETFNRAMNDPEWGLGYLAGLAIITPLAILVVATLYSVQHVPQLKGLLSFVDTSSEIKAAAMGAIVGLVMRFVIEFIKIKA